MMGSGTDKYSHNPKDLLSQVDVPSIEGDDINIAKPLAVDEGNNEGNNDNEGMDDNEDDVGISIQEPYIGQAFDILNDVYNCYNCYALHTGFGIRKSSSSKSQLSGELIWKKFVCHKAGFKILTCLDGCEVVRRRDTRVGCMAKVDVRRNKYGKWVITSFVKEHNHTLDTPKTSHNESHKNAVAKNLIDQLQSCGMAPSRIAKTMNATFSARHSMVSGVSEAEANDNIVTPTMKWCLSTLANKAVEKAASSVTTYRDLYSMLNGFLDKFDKFRSADNQIAPTVVDNQIGFNAISCGIPEISVQDPQVVRTMGKPMIVSAIPTEIEVTQKLTKKRKCGSCGDKGHYMTTCLKKAKAKENIM